MDLLLYFTLIREEKKMVIYLLRQNERGHNFSWAF